MHEQTAEAAVLQGYFASFLTGAKASLAKGWDSFACVGALGRSSGREWGVLEGVSKSPASSQYRKFQLHLSEAPSPWSPYHIPPHSPPPFPSLPFPSLHHHAQGRLGKPPLGLVVVPLPSL